MRIRIKCVDNKVLFSMKCILIVTLNTEEWQLAVYNYVLTQNVIFCICFYLISLMY